MTEGGSMKSVAALMDPTHSLCHTDIDCWTLHLSFKIISIQINNLGNK